MKIRTIVAATSAALFALGAVAAGDEKQNQSQSSQQPAASGATSGQGSQKQAQSSDLVKQAQQKLKAAGHDVGAADGILGPKTQAGLKEFQQSKGLQASGQLDKQTLAALGVSGEVTSGASAATGGSSSAGQSKGQSATSAQSSEKPKQ